MNLNLFNSQTKTKLVGQVKGKFMNITSTTAGVFEPLSRFQNYLRNKTDESSVFLSAISDTITPSDILLDDSPALDKSKLYYTELTDDQFDVLASGLCKYTKISSNIDSDDYDVLFSNIHVTLIDASGAAYSIYGHNGETVINGKQVVLSQSLSPTFEEEIICWKDSAGHIFFKEVLMSNDYLRYYLHEHYHFNLNTIYGICEDITYSQKEGTPTDLTNGLFSFLTECMNFITKSSYTFDNYVQMMDTYHDRFGDSPTSIFNLVQLISSRCGFLSNVSERYSTIYDIFYSQYESDAINTILLTLIQSIATDSVSDSTFTVLLEQDESIKYKSVKNMLIFMRNSFVQNGIYGLCMSVLEYAKAGAKVTSDDGVMQFSDNSSYVPQQYIATLVGTIVTSIASVIGTIVFYFFKIAGALIMAAGAFLGKIISNVIEYDQAATRVGVLNTNRAQFNNAPYGLFQTEISLADPMYNPINNKGMQYLVNRLESFGSPFMVEVPGGYIHIGSGGMDDTGEKIMKIRFEFHPSLYDHVHDIINFQKSVLKYSASEGRNEDAWWVDGGVVEGFTPYKIHIKFGSTLHKQLSHIWADKESVQHWFDNDSQDGDDPSLKRLNPTDDWTVKKILTANTWCFLYWIYNSQFVALHPGVTTSDYYSFTFDLVDWQNDKRAIFGRSTALVDHPCHLLAGSDTGFEAYASLLGLILCSQVRGYKAIFDEGEWQWEETDTLLDTYEDFEDCPLAASCTWTEISMMLTNLELRGISIYNNTPYTFVNEGNDDIFVIKPIISLPTCIRRLDFYDGSDVDIPQNMQYYLVPVHYEATTFWSWLIAAAIITAVVTIGIAVASIKFKRYQRMKRAQNNAAVENAWDAFKKNPTKEGYTNYKKTVKKTRISRLIVGGTRYDYENYWNGDTSESSTDTINSGVLSQLNLDEVIDDDVEATDLKLQQMTDGDGDNEVPSLLRIETLITGR